MKFYRLGAGHFIQKMVSRPDDVGLEITISASQVPGTLIVLRSDIRYHARLLHSIISIDPRQLQMMYN